MSTIKNVFISHSLKDRALSDKLIDELRGHHIAAVSAGQTIELGGNWQREIEQTAKAADAVVILIDSRHEPDRHQQFEWSTALEAEWENPGKPLIPVLFGKAELPSFLSGREVLRVKDYRKKWEKAVGEWVRTLNDKPSMPREWVSVEREDPAKRRERLQYIEEAANSLKVS